MPTEPGVRNVVSFDVPEDLEAQRSNEVHLNAQEQLAASSSVPIAPRSAPTMATAARSMQRQRRLTSDIIASASALAMDAARSESTTSIAWKPKRRVKASSSSSSASPFLFERKSSSATLTATAATTSTNHLTSTTLDHLHPMHAHDHATSPGNGTATDPSRVIVPRTTVWACFKQTVMKNADAIAIRGQHHQQPHHSRSALDNIDSGHENETQLTWQMYQEQVERMAKVWIELGFRVGDGVVLDASSSPALYVIQMSLMAIGGVLCHVRSNWSEQELVDDIVPLAQASIVILDTVDTPVWQQVLLQAQESLLAVVVLSPSHTRSRQTLIQHELGVRILTYQDVETRATELCHDQDLSVQLDRMAAEVAPTDCCVIAFAYDPDGNVQGACLSQDNVVYTASILAHCFGPLSSGDRMVAYLPLYHVAAYVLEFFVPLVSGISVICAPSYRHEKLMDIISRRKPTIFFATPDTWEHISSQVYRAKSEANSFLYQWAKTRATHNSDKLRFGSASHRSLGYMLAKKFVLNNIKRKIGLESCHACYSVLAPLDLDLEGLFKTIDVPIYQLYGCAETCGFAAINYPHSWVFGSSGHALQGTTMKNEEQTTHDVLYRGRNVFMGYRRRSFDSDQFELVLPFTPDGWYRLPQPGHLTPQEEFLMITDTPQDFVVLSTGEYVPIAPFEDALVAFHPELDQAVLVGDNRGFVSVLLFLKTSLTTSISKHSKVILSDEALQVGRSIGSDATTVSEVIKCQAWAIHFDQVLEDLPNKLRVSNVRIRKWIVMADAFSVESGELDPETGHVKRKTVNAKYRSLLDSLYR